MSFFTHFTVLLALASTTLSAPTPIQDLQISDLVLLCQKSNATAPLFDCKLKYTLTDPNAAAKNFTAAAQCEHQWQWDGKSTEKGTGNTFDDTYKLCYRVSGRALQSAVAGFGGPDDLSLRIISSYMSDSFTYLSLFADAELAPLTTVSETAEKKLYSDDTTQSFVVNGMTA